MRRYLIALTFLLSIPALAPAPIDVAIDLDGLLFVDTNQGSREGDVITVKGKKVRIAEGAREFLASLAADPRLRLSFYSANDGERNKEGLRQIILPGGKSALDIVGGRVYARDEMVPGPSGDVKDLTRVAKGVDLSRAILIDDQTRYSAPGQEKNLLLAWHADHHSRLARTLGFLDRVLAESEKTGLSPVEVLDSLQWELKEGKWRFRPDSLGDEAVRRGLERMKKVNATYAPPKEENTESAKQTSFFTMSGEALTQLAAIHRNRRDPCFLPGISVPGRDRNRGFSPKRYRIRAGSGSPALAHPLLKQPVGEGSKHEQVFLIRDRVFLGDRDRQRPEPRSGRSSAA